MQLYPGTRHWDWRPPPALFLPWESTWRIGCPSGGQVAYCYQRRRVFEMTRFSRLQATTCATRLCKLRPAIYAAAQIHQDQSDETIHVYCTSMHTNRAKVTVFYYSTHAIGKTLCTRDPHCICTTCSWFIPLFSCYYKLYSSHALHKILTCHCKDLCSFSLKSISEVSRAGAGMSRRLQLQEGWVQNGFLCRTSLTKLPIQGMVLSNILLVFCLA